MSFLEFFNALDSIICLTGFIEYAGINARFRIEKDSSRASNNISVKIDEVADWASKVNASRTFGAFKIGYKDNVPEILNGLEITHGEINYSTPLNNTDKSLNKVCKWIASSEIIEETRRKQIIDNPTLDTKYDKDIVILDCLLDPSQALVSRRIEDFQEVPTGILAPELATNLRISPARNAYRWGQYLGACLIEKQNEDLTITKSATNHQLSSLLIGENNAVAEGENIQIKMLDAAFETNNIITIGDTIISIDDYKLMEDSTDDLIQATIVGVEYFGVIRLTNFNPSKKSGTFELIQSNR
jgi:hypothetical protein